MRTKKNEMLTIKLTAVHASLLMEAFFRDFSKRHPAYFYVFENFTKKIQGLSEDEACLISAFLHELVDDDIRESVIDMSFEGAFIELRNYHGDSSCGNLQTENKRTLSYVEFFYFLTQHDLSKVSNDKVQEVTEYLQNKNHAEKHDPHTRVSFAAERNNLIEFLTNQPQLEDAK